MNARLSLLFLLVTYLHGGITVGGHRSSPRLDLTDVSVMFPSDLNLTVSQGQPMAVTATLSGSGSVALEEDYVSATLYKVKAENLFAKHEVGTVYGLADRCLANKFCIDVRVSDLDLMVTVIISDCQFRDRGEYVIKVNTRKKDEEQFLDQGAAKFRLHVLHGENSTDHCSCRRRRRGRKAGHKVKSKSACQQDGNTECP